MEKQRLVLVAGVVIVIRIVVVVIRVAVVAIGMVVRAGSGLCFIVVLAAFVRFQESDTAHEEDAEH